MKLKYDLKGLDCANCAQKVQERVSDLKGIKECNVVFATTKMFVETIDDSFDEALLIKTVKSVEPDVEVI
ncbi:cation transporter, partial [Thomasclavelia cocleata]